MSKIPTELKIKRGELIHKLGLKHVGFGRYVDEKGRTFRFQKSTDKLINLTKKKKHLRKKAVERASKFLNQNKHLSDSSKKIGLYASILGMRISPKAKSFHGSASQAKGLLRNAVKNGYKVEKQGSKFTLKDNSGNRVADVQFKNNRAAVIF